MKLISYHAHEIGTKPKAILTPEQSLVEAVWVMSAYDVQWIPICDHEKNLLGVISSADLAYHFPPNPYAMQMLNLDIGDTVVPKVRIKDVMTSLIVTATEDEEVLNIIELLTRRHFVDSRYTPDSKRFITNIPLVQGNKIISVVGCAELLKNIDPRHTLVSDVMSTRHIPVVHINHKIKEAHYLMHSKGHRFILVVDDQQHPVGMVSDTQLLKYIREPYQLSELPVHVMMTDISCFVPISPDDTIHKAIALLLNKHISLRAFPVTSHGELVGIISYLDVLRKVQELETTLDR